MIAVATLMFAAMAAVGVTTLVSGHRRAQSAADLTALSAAQTAAHGGDACATAARVAAYHQARMVGCDLRSSTVRIAVAIPTYLGFGITMEVSAEAKAGSNTRS